MKCLMALWILKKLITIAQNVPKKIHKKDLLS
jgi:hypothetical protein